MSVTSSSPSSHLASSHLSSPAHGAESSAAPASDSSSMSSLPSSSASSSASSPSAGGFRPGNRDGRRGRSGEGSSARTVLKVRKRKDRKNYPACRTPARTAKQFHGYCEKCWGKERKKAPPEEGFGVQIWKPLCLALVVGFAPHSAPTSLNLRHNPPRRPSLRP